MDWETIGDKTLTTVLKGGIDEGDLYTAAIELDDITLDEDNIPCAAWLWSIDYRTRVDGRIERIKITSGVNDTLHGAYNAMLHGAIACRVITLQEYEEITGLRSAL
ncbi:hypothetical protein SEA_GODONK_233 [Gordonia phage GodonK]|uniref:Uncharacterized protein n=1 Tax=Gordonia phage GodonK TaxID=2562192 RepID=A0A4D6E2T5_9CAUD|nr:hypothetical protein HOV33_gp007 [Gordonia phage GodonK]YP_009821586.1 hypothetical protein HOV33_gp135 [Gordonia phage GodonK]QBZ72626.1 hypothetical protein SEA_GODONK_7 [Gordonia phage GodonK]QBZ72821.1 hypothetical protein SEA_GODONK_233 [Gordonia phage GodonK]